MWGHPLLRCLPPGTTRASQDGCVRNRPVLLTRAEIKRQAQSAMCYTTTVSNCVWATPAAASCRRPGMMWWWVEVPGCPAKASPPQHHHCLCSQRWWRASRWNDECGPSAGFPAPCIRPETCMPASNRQQPVPGALHASCHPAPQASTPQNCRGLALRPQPRGGVPAAGGHCEKPLQRCHDICMCTHTSAAALVLQVPHSAAAAVSDGPTNHQVTTSRSQAAQQQPTEGRLAKGWQQGSAS